MFFTFQGETSTTLGSSLPIAVGVDAGDKDFWTYSVLERRRFHALLGFSLSAYPILKNLSGLDPKGSAAVARHKHSKNKVVDHRPFE